MTDLVELPAAAAPFLAELRDESFYLGAADSTAPFTVHLAEPFATEPRPQATFTVPGRHLPALLAALREVGHRAPSPSWAPTGDNPWRATPTSESGLRLSGPIRLHGAIQAEADDLPVQAIEVEYRYLWSLRISCGDHPPSV